MSESDNKENDKQIILYNKKSKPIITMNPELFIPLSYWFKRESKPLFFWTPPMEKFILYLEKEKFDKIKETKEFNKDYIICCIQKDKHEYLEEKNGIIVYDVIKTGR